MLSRYRIATITLIAPLLTIIVGCSGNASPSDDAGGNGGPLGTGASGGSAGQGGADNASGSGGSGETGSGGQGGSAGTAGAGGLAGSGGVAGSGGSAGKGGAGRDASAGAGGARDAGGDGAAGQPPDGGSSTCRPAGTMTVTDFGGTAYQIDGANNPPLTLCRGATYRLEINAPGHPFFVQTADGVTYNDGVSDNGTTSGEIVFVVPNSAPDLLRYRCSIHPEMTGPIYLLN